MKPIRIINCIFLFFLGSTLLAQTSWENPIQKQGWLGSPLVETSPFVFKDRLYLLENQQRFWDLPGGKSGDDFQDDEVRIRDIASDKIISIALKNHSLLYRWRSALCRRPAMGNL